LAGLNQALWKGRKVLITGHTGFKGSWMARVLQMLGSEVSGFALAPDTDPSHFDLLKLDMNSKIGDIREPAPIADFVKKTQPEILIHMAAQPLVLKSYEDPRGTYETNVMGTLNVLEAVRMTPSIKAVVVVTSDKAYENRETTRPYSEDDPMGGYDPYSSSKGCTELLTSSYRQSFFNLNHYGKDHGVLLASGRAGNVLGGGDWAVDRLVPDLARAYRDKRKVVLRNLSAVRPWQHVLEPVVGYLMLAERLFEGDRDFARGWNFGPSVENCWSVDKIVARAVERWPGFAYEVTDPRRHEARYLMLDSTQAREKLGWRPQLDIKETLDWTLNWYEAFIGRGTVSTDVQISAYLKG
jgi:CDP-glucose 4,6-dehydratase